jgi:transposase
MTCRMKSGTGWSRCCLLTRHGAGRPPAFDPARHKERNTVECCSAKLKQFRAVATRYDKREQIYQGTVDAASIRIWLPPEPWICQVGYCE